MTKQFDYNDKVNYNGEKCTFIMDNGDGTSTISTPQLAGSEIAVPNCDITKYSIFNDLVSKFNMLSIKTIIIFSIILVICLFSILIGNRPINNTEVIVSDNVETVVENKSYHHIFDIKLIYTDGTIDTTVIEYDGIYKDGVYLDQKLVDGNLCVYINNKVGNAVVACGIRRYKEISHKIE